MKMPQGLQENSHEIQIKKKCLKVNTNPQFGFRFTCTLRRRSYTVGIDFSSSSYLRFNPRALAASLHLISNEIVARFFRIPGYLEINRCIIIIFVHGGTECWIKIFTHYIPTEHSPWCGQQCSE